MQFDIAIIGAGASGLMLASHLKNKRVCLIDSNAHIGAKIKISGGGKCNITNESVSAKNYLGNENFVQTILDQFSSADFLNFCQRKSLAVSLNEKLVKGTYFCKTSKDVLTLFEHLTQHCKYFLNHKVLKVSYDNYFSIETNKSTIQAKQLVIASGGLSFTNLGASSIAFDIAKTFGHKVNVLNPALVGFTVQKEQFWFKQLSGLSTFVQLKVNDKLFEGNILFAHKGCSGPVILNASLYWQKGQIQIDFLPSKRMEHFFNSNKKISSALPLPKRFVQAFLDAMQLEDKAMSTLNSEEKKVLMQLKAYTFSPAGNFGYTKAEVTKGGVCTGEVNPYTMQSMLHEDLFFLGECLDVTGELGGYNFQFAWASAMVAARYLQH